MIKTVAKAKRVQQRRAAAGKQGLSRAVRAFLKRQGLTNRALA